MHNQIACRYGLAAGDALIFYPLCIHVGDFYNKSNIRVHYYALKADTDWELDTDYELLNDEARDLKAVNSESRHHSFSWSGEAELIGTNHFTSQPDILVP